MFLLHSLWVLLNLDYTPYGDCGMLYYVLLIIIKSLWIITEKSHQSEKFHCLNTRAYASQFRSEKSVQTFLLHFRILVECIKYYYYYIYCVTELKLLKGSNISSIFSSIWIIHCLLYYLRLSFWRQPNTFSLVIESLPSPFRVSSNERSKWGFWLR